MTCVQASIHDNFSQYCNFTLLNTKPDKILAMTQGKFLDSHLINKDLTVMQIKELGWMEVDLWRLKDNFQ